MKSNFFRILGIMLPLLALGVTASAQTSTAVTSPERSEEQEQLRKIIEVSEKQKSKIATVRTESELRRQREALERENERKSRLRLEELRLEDERRRAQQIEEFGQTPTPVVVTQPQLSSPQPVASARGADSESGIGPVFSSSAETSRIAPNESNYTVAIRPRGGLANIAGSNLSISPRFAVGAALELAATDQLSAEASYTYSEYGVSLASSDILIAQLQALQSPLGQGAIATMGYKQNMIDVGGKFFILDQDYKVRPFVGAGAGYSRGFINFNRDILRSVSNYYGFNYSNYSSDYELSQYLGSLSAGVDLRLTKYFSVGLSAKYSYVFSAIENYEMPRVALVNPYYYPYYANPGSADKQLVGSSLANAGFYSVLAGASIEF